MKKSKAQQEVDEFLSAYTTPSVNSVTPKFDDLDDNIDFISTENPLGTIDFTSSILNLDGLDNNINIISTEDPFNLSKSFTKAKLAKNITLDDGSIFFKGTTVDSLNLLFLDEEWDKEFFSKTSDEPMRENNTTYEACINSKFFIVKLSDLIPFQS